MTKIGAAIIGPARWPTLVLGRSLRFENRALGNLVFSNSQNPGLYGNIHIHHRSQQER